jgi:hypothetical protein
MFSLFLSHSQTNQSFIWFGGYSHDFIRTFTGGNESMSNHDVESMIQWVDLPETETQWTAPLDSVRVNVDTTGFNMLT